MSPHASPTSYVLAASPRYDRTYGTPIRPARLRRADVCPLCPGMPLVDDARYASSAPRCVKLSFRRPLAYRRPLSCHPSLVAALAPWFDSSSDAHPGREVRGGLTIIGKARKAKIIAAMSPQVVRPCVSPLLLTSQPPPPHIIKTPTSASSHQPHPPVGLIFTPFVISYMYVYTDGLRPARRAPSSAPFLLLCSLPSHSASCLLSSLRCAIIISFILCVLSPPAIYLSPPCFPLPPRLWPLVLSRFSLLSRSIFPQPSSYPAQIRLWMGKDGSEGEGRALLLLGISTPTPVPYLLSTASLGIVPLRTLYH
ncbi:hypothetical protein VTO73DRAFT_14402 [Trametes versicolor]